MKPKLLGKRIVDLIMALLLPLLMAEVITGQELHEWLGIGMMVMFLLHHVLNLGWWKSLRKGRYTPARSFGVAINFLLLADMLALAVSGVMMSDYVFDFLPISGGAVLARRLHLLASYWGLLLMSAHLGLHMELVFGAGRKLFHISHKSAVRTWTLRGVTMIAVLLGVYAFFDLHIPDYLFLKAAFVLFDEARSAPVFFMETVAVLWLFAALAYEVNKLLRMAKVQKASCRTHRT
jgi:hypothetical protein